MAHRTVPKKNVTEGAAASIGVRNQPEESPSLHGRAVPMMAEQAGAEIWAGAEKIPVRAFPATVVAAAPRPVAQASAEAEPSKQGDNWDRADLPLQPDNAGKDRTVPMQVLPAAQDVAAPRPEVVASRVAVPSRRAQVSRPPTQAWLVAPDVPVPRPGLVAYPGQRKTPGCNSLGENEPTEAQPRVSLASVQRTDKVPLEVEAPALLPEPELSGQTPSQDWLMQTFSSLYLLTTSIHSNRPSDGSHVVAF